MNDVTDAPDKIIVNVQYNVPRYVLATPGKQNRACTGFMRMTPGVTEAYEFVYVNTDGVPINLNGFTLRIVFWFPQPEYELLGSNIQSNIALAKDLTINSPYEGVCTLVLTDQETLTIARNGRTSLRWSIYMIGANGEVFPTQITANGERYGSLDIDRSEIPNAETIKGLSISGAGVT